MFRRRKNRIGAAVALAAVLALGLAAPAGAVGWGGWGEARELSGGLLQHVFAWLELIRQPEAVLKCDQGGHIDPNGSCQKGTGVRRLSGRTVENSLSREQF
jgi:hypothetical protein